MELQLNAPVCAQKYADFKACGNPTDSAKTLTVKLHCIWQEVWVDGNILLL